jgi:hypothetical protein
VGVGARRPTRRFYSGLDLLVDESVYFADWLPRFISICRSRNDNQWAELVAYKEKLGICVVCGVGAGAGIYWLLQMTAFHMSLGPSTRIKLQVKLLRPFNLDDYAGICCLLFQVKILIGQFSNRVYAYWWVA